jgi:hypothetical protein
MQSVVAVTLVQKDEFLFTMDTKRIGVMEITQHSMVCVNAAS